MRNTCFLIVFLSVVWPVVSLGAQPPADKATKPGAPVRDKAAQADDPAVNQSGKQAGKEPEGGVKLGPPPSEAEKLLDQAIEKVEQLKQFRCAIRQITEIFGYRFTADGQYAIAPDYKMLYEIKVNLTDTTGTLKEVSDGQTHWRNQKIFDEQQLERTDLKRVRTLIDSPQFDKDRRNRVFRGLGFSGMVPLMRALRESLKFETSEESTLNDMPVYVLNGQWDEKVMSQASFRGQQLNVADLPGKFPYIPSRIAVWIGREDGWLHKVEMEGSKEVQGTLTKLTLEFLNPQVGVQLPDSLFVFEAPPGVNAVDRTEFTYQQLSLYLQQSQGSRGGAAPSGAGSDKSKTKAE